MNATIIRALREFQLELMAISREYWNDSINTREYHDKQDSAMQRCKLKIEIALEKEEKDDSDAAKREAQFLKDWSNI